MMMMMNVAAETCHDGDLTVIFLLSTGQSVWCRLPQCSNYDAGGIPWKGDTRRQSCFGFWRVRKFGFWSLQYSAKETLNCQNFPFSFSLTATLYVCPYIYVLGDRIHEDQSNTNHTVTLKMRWQDTNQYHTWFHQSIWFATTKPNHYANTLLVSIIGTVIIIIIVIIHHCLQPRRKPTKTKIDHIKIVQLLFTLLSFENHCNTITYLIDVMNKNLTWH